MTPSSAAKLTAEAEIKHYLESPPIPGPGQAVQATMDAATAPLRTKIVVLRAVLRELADIVDLAVTKDYTLDHFTTQPARMVLANAPADCAHLAVVPCDELEGLKRNAEKTDELARFVQRITLVLQANRSTTPEQFDRAFQDAYSLYSKFDLDGTQARNAAQRGEKAK